MTRKDYKLIAQALHDALVYQSRVTYPPAFIQGHRAATFEIANALQASNPRFDRAKFTATAHGKMEEY